MRPGARRSTSASTACRRRRPAHAIGVLAGRRRPDRNRAGDRSSPTSSTNSPSGPTCCSPRSPSCARSRWASSASSTRTTRLSLGFLFGASVLLSMVLGPCNTVTANVVPPNRRAAALRRVHLSHPPVRRHQLADPPGLDLRAVWQAECGRLVDRPVLRLDRRERRSATPT